MIGCKDRSMVVMAVENKHSGRDIKWSLGQCRTCKVFAALNITWIPLYQLKLRKYIPLITIN